MNCDRNSLLLYPVTDRAWLSDRPLFEDVEKALMGGATMIQLREKNISKEEFLDEAIEIGGLCRKYKVPFIVNDDVDIAINSGADGVHVGQSDLDCLDARKLLGPEKMVGVSAQTVEQARLAEKNGADYLGVGAVFTTSTKLDADAVSYDTLKAICEAVSIPVVAIGGIYAHNIEKLKGSGIVGVALVSSIFAENDIKAATEKMRALAYETVN